MEAPRSTARALGSFAWRMPGESGSLLQGSDFSLNAAVGMEDALVFFGAFHPGVASELSAQGQVTAHLRAAGWPPRLKEGEVATAGIRLEGGSLSAPLRSGPGRLVFADGQWSLPEMELVFEPNAGIFNIELTGTEPRAGHRSRSPKKRSVPSLQLQGSVDDARQILTVASALGYTLPHGWNVTGPMDADLQWDVSARPFSPWPSGNLTLDGVEIRASFLASPVGPITAQLDLSPRGELLHLRLAQAFGSAWSGELSHHPGDNGWNGPLSAEAVDIARFDEALNPSRRTSLLQTILPFLRPAHEPAAVPTELCWSGELQVANLQARDLRLSRLRADAELNERTLVLKNLEAGLWGGTVAGSFSAHLNSQPLYQSNLKFDGMALGQLTAPSLQRRFAGLADGTIRISASGLTPAALWDSLQCDGEASIGDLQLNFVNLPQSLAEARLRDGSSRFEHARTDFSCAGRQIQFTHLELSEDRVEIIGRGTADLSRHLNFRLAEAALPPSSAPNLSAADAPGGEFILGGTLDSPELHSIPGAPRR